jgi:hypothetical protein
MGNMVGVLYEAGTTSLSRANVSALGFWLGSVLLIFLVFCVVLCFSFVCLRYVSCVPSVVNRLECPFAFLLFLFPIIIYVSADMSIPNAPLLFIEKLYRHHWLLTLHILLRYLRQPGKSAVMYVY